MKKIRLTENELKRMIVNVMEQVADNNPNEGEPNKSSEEYDQRLVTQFYYRIHDDIRDIQEAIYALMDLFQEIAEETSIDPEDKEDMLDMIRHELTQLGVSYRDYDYADDYDQTIDVDQKKATEDIDDETVTGDMDDENQ